MTATLTKELAARCEYFYKGLDDRDFAIRAALQAHASGDLVSVPAAELEALRRDAERYRWWRSNIHYIQEDEDGLEGMAFSYQVNLKIIEHADKADLCDAVADSGIEMDAAMKAKP